MSNFPTYEELVEYIAKSICRYELDAQNDQHRDVEEPTSDWYRGNPEHPQYIWELRKEAAQAALQALLKNLPLMETTGEEEFMSEIQEKEQENAGYYQQLLSYKKDDEGSDGGA